MENENGLMTIDKESGEMVPVESNALTSAQARVNAVSHALDEAMSRASMLEITEEETQKLLALFPDEAFRRGAAGKDNLIYIEHAFLRDRLTEVFGMGRWACIRTRPHWAENYEVWDDKKNKYKPAVRVYADCALVIRGCYIAEAIGDMSYFPDNASMNYGDAAEGAQTQALRRCAKNLGIGLQAWKKDWCEGWMKRNPTGTRPPAPQPAQQLKTETKAEVKADPVNPNLETLVTTIGNMDALAMAAITTPKEVWRATQEAWVNEFGKPNLGRLQKAVAARGTALKEVKPPVVEEAHFEEVNPNDSTPSLDTMLNEQEVVPATYEEWEALICKTGVAGIDKVKALVNQHVTLNGKMTGAAKKKILDVLKAQEEAINGGGE